MIKKAERLKYFNISFFPSFNFTWDVRFKN